MFFHFSCIRFMTKPLWAVCKIMRCILTYSSVVQQLPGFVYMFWVYQTNIFFCAMWRQLMRQMTQKLQVHCCLVHHFMKAMLERPNFVRWWNFTAFIQSAVMTITKFTYHISKDANVSQVCLKIAAECNSCSNLQCQDPVLAGCNQIGPPQCND